jgi:hypothetical protein
VTKAGKKHIPIPPSDLGFLADVYRHVFARGRTPEEAKSQILEALESGRVPHQVDRTIEYLPRTAADPLDQLPPSRTLENQPMPLEVLARGIAGGRGSLHIDWRSSNAVRRAGVCRNAAGDDLRWQRISFYGIRCSWKHVLMEWLITHAKQPKAPELPRALSSKDWLTAELNRRKEANNIPTGYGAQKKFSAQLEKQMAKDFKAGKCLRALGDGRIANMLIELKLWPVK